MIDTISSFFLLVNFWQLYSQFADFRRFLAEIVVSVE